MRLQGKVALVTGGSLGIGRATAYRFAQEGAKVAITGRNQHDLEETAAFIRASGGEVLPIVSDVQHKSQVEAMLDQIESEWGPLEIAVNNAGICEMSTFLDITEDAWDRHIAINLKGSFLVGQAAAKRMVASKTAGSIIHMSSVNGIKAEANQAHYNATKGGVNLLAMSMAVELAEYGIRVNALCPGFIATRLTQSAIDNPEEIGEYLKTIPMKRVGHPDEIADTAVFLASDDSRYMTGHCLVVDGGQIIKLG